jgi:hypothetical protein
MLLFSLLNQSLKPRWERFKALMPVRYSGNKKTRLGGFKRVLKRSTRMAEDIISPAFRSGADRTLQRGISH